MSYLVGRSLRSFLEAMRDPRRDAIISVYDEYEELFHHAAGSSHNHQAWPGGYADHLAECLRVSEVYYEALQKVRPVTFTKDQATICLFFHDLEKPFRYGPEDHPEVQKWKAYRERQADNSFNDMFEFPEVEVGESWEKVKWAVLRDFQLRYQIYLDDDEINALRYTHGEGSAHQKTHRIAGPLAAHVHHCDNTSARIWFDEGKGLSRGQDVEEAYGINYDPEVLFPFLGSRAEKGKSAVSQFLMDRSKAPLDEVAEATGLSLSTVQGYVDDLAGKGAVQPLKDGVYKWLGLT